MIDYHIHSEHSVDAAGSLREYVEQARLLGLKEICFTNHCELDTKRSDNLIRFDNQQLPITRENLLRLQDQIWSLKKDYQKSGLRIRFGLEVGYYEGIEARLKAMTEGLDLDFLIAGIHCLDHICIDSSKECKLYFVKKGAEELLENYYQAIENLIKAKLFDAVAHFDIYKKYGSDFYGTAINHFDKAWLANIFSLMQKNGIALELNTAGLRRQNHFYPCAEIMDLAKKSKIEFITIGSDCHKVADLGNGIAEAMAYARSFGFNRVCGFEKRRPYAIKI